jgi:hypothetical protein
MASLHARNILSQFTKQAVPFSQAPAIADQQALQQIRKAAKVRFVSFLL